MNDVLSTFSLQGRVALVTGASRGIGRALAEALAGAGARVLLAGRDTSALTEVHAAIAGAGGHCAVIPMDVADSASRAAAFAAIEAQEGQLDILINNAGIEQVKPSAELDEATWDRIVDTNLKGAFFCAQAAMKLMPNGGSIVNLCSLTSEVGVPGAVPYGASKSGLAGMTRALATEWAPLGVRVNGIGPGYFHTDLTDVFYQDADWCERMRGKIPLGRFGDLRDLAGSVVFLCSPAAAYITGQVLYVDGGYLASI
ncbi:SDR family NAD(P)-dependent oxidoreductase [Pseudomonas matsuisoli]|uniref:2-deoxy-D-gluconate 3-dehydrogenase n=1 Tax=Pseudomonas matsuisoli TaxID=1515666 RepID=A0A917PU21_9PSED|nr:SDR family oxidoreductase [Pseudomonas matsuisoli]GGJ91934.1 2-deoxy-D-gluconate 3-dehydrogenase [Pseudomonas matsuisoli]